jgi:DNA invertase Pin-like site-specific DNA recombinase
MIRAGLYIRVSTDEQALHGLSLDSQREALTAYAKEHNMQIVDIYADEGITARKALNKRLQFQRLISDVKAGKIDLILVTKLDRWFRNIKDYHNTQEILESITATGEPSMRTMTPALHPAGYTSILCCQ